MKYRKKPVVIEAFQYDGDLIFQDGTPYAPEWAMDAFGNGTIYYDSLTSDSPPCELFIKTLEGIHHVSVGDFIIQGVNGELYPCKPDIFEKTYEPAEVDEAQKFKDYENAVAVASNDAIRIVKALVGKLGGEVSLLASDIYRADQVTLYRNDPDKFGSVKFTLGGKGKRRNG